MIIHKGVENAFSIVEDKKGQIWFSAFRNGLFNYQPKTGKFSGYNHDPRNPHSLSSSYVRAILEDSRGRIWVGTESGGLNRVLETNGQVSFQRYNHDNSDSSSVCDDNICTIFEGSNGYLWIGTFAGLVKFDTDSEIFKKIGKKDGLPNEVIYSIQEDNDKNLWIGSNRGISRYNTNDGEVKNFTKDDGLQGMGFFQNSSVRLKSGKLLFGGIEGFNEFNPAEIRNNVFEPKIYFSDFKVSNSPVKTHRLNET